MEIIIQVLTERENTQRFAFIYTSQK